METYNFKAANWVLFVLTLIVSVISLSFLSMFITKQGLLPKENAFVSLLSFGVSFLLVIYIIRLTSFARVEITLSYDTISIKWLEQFLFSNKQDVAIPFREIVTYSNKSDPHWQWLKMELTNGTVYRIFHSNLALKDDYSKFADAFVSSVQNYNEHSPEGVQNPFGA